MTVLQWVAAMTGALTSAAVGFGVWRLQRCVNKAEAKREETEKAREKNEILLIKSCAAAIALGEATALALKNGKSNGETERALTYARAVKHEQKDFLCEQGIKAIY